MSFGISTPKTVSCELQKRFFFSLQVIQTLEFSYGSRKGTNTALSKVCLLYRIRIGFIISEQRGKSDFCERNGKGIETD